MSSPPWMRTIFARGGSPPDAPARSSDRGSAVCDLCVGGFRHYAARHATEDGPLRGILLRAVCGCGLRAELGDVSDRAIDDSRPKTLRPPIPTVLTIVRYL